MDLRKLHKARGVERVGVFLGEFQYGGNKKEDKDIH